MAMKQTLNSAELMTGIDGYLLLEHNGANICLAEVGNFSVVMNYNVVEKQAVGNPVVQRVPSGISYDLTMTEMVVRDDTIIGPLLEAAQNGKIPRFNFQGVTQKPDGQEQRVAFNNAVPNGAFGLMNVTPGEVIEREMSFSLNEVPKFISQLASTYLAGN